MLYKHSMDTALLMIVKGSDPFHFERMIDTLQHSGKEACTTHKEIENREGGRERELLMNECTRFLEETQHQAIDSYMRKNDVESTSSWGTQLQTTTAWVSAASGMMTSAMNLSILSSAACSSSIDKNGELSGKIPA